MDYAVRMESPEEKVTVVLQAENDGDDRHVLVTGVGSGPLFFSVLGCVTHAMAAHSDSVWVGRWENHES
jgi:hypothetical protein